MASDDPPMPKTTLITGASTGIGYELAKLFAADGHNLVLVARNAAKLQTAADDLHRQFSITATPIAKDLSSPAAVTELAADLQNRDLVIDTLVNNAGFGAAGPFVKINTDAQLDMLQVNIISLVHLTRLLLPAMIQRNTGGLLNISSTAAFQPGPYMAVYYASKAFVLSFTEALAEELRLTNVHVSALCPGPTRTQFQDRAGIGDSALFKGKFLRIADAASVAKAGYIGLQRRKRIVVPGLLNKISTQIVRVAPRSITAKIAAAINRSK